MIPPPQERTPTLAELNVAFSETVPDTGRRSAIDRLFAAPAVMPSSLEIEALLRTARTIAVVGLSAKPFRDSYVVAKYLQAAGYRILPVNPVLAASSDPTILGEPCHSSLTSAAYSLGEGKHIDIVNVFRKSADVPPIVDEAVVMDAQAIWLQLGITHEASAAFALEMGLVVVQDRCIKIEHRRVMG